jgi:hypothetical protein
MVSGILRGGYRACGWALLALILLLAGLRAYGQLRYGQARETFVAGVGPLEVERYQPPAFLDSYWLTDGVLAVDLAVDPDADSDLDPTFDLARGSAVRLLLERPDAAWDRRDRQRLRRLVRDNRGALDVLHAAAGQRLSVGLDPSGAAPFARPLDLRAFLRAARLLHLEGRLLLDQERPAQAAVSALALASLADALLREPVLECQQIGAEVERGFLDLVRRLLPAADAPTLRRVADSLQRLQPGVAALRRSLGAEASTIVHELSVRQRPWEEETVATAGHFRLEERWVERPREVAASVASATAASAAPVAESASPRAAASAGGEANPLAGLDAVERTVYRWTQELQLAALLERYTRLVRSAERPYALLAQSLAGQGRAAASRWLLADLLAPNLAALTERVQVTASSRQLATMAVDLRLQALEAQRPPQRPTGPPAAPRSPYTAEPLVSVTGSDGTIELAYPRAEELWQRRGGQRLPPVRLRWTVPPPKG